VLQQLCPDFSWFTDGLSEFGSKDQAVEIEGKWIVELAEMKGFGRDLDQIKAFVSRAAENYRPPYGRREVHSPRRCVFAATVNPEQAGYFRDATGNRRYWPIECKKQAPEITPEMRDRMWAEARERFQAGENWWLEDATLIAAAEEEQRKRMVVDNWTEPIEAWLVGKSEVTVSEILGECIKKELSKRENMDGVRVGRVMALLGWERWRPPRVNGKQPPWRYRNPNVEQMTLRRDDPSWLDAS
jgi:putative DNA primase/helicase